MENKGFTLAEVLITLAIIGIVAALTIPNINLYIRNKQLESGFWKSYSLLSQSILQMKNDEVMVWANYNYNDNHLDSDFSYYNFKNSFKKYFRVLFDCKDNYSKCPFNATKYRNFTNTNYFANTSILPPAASFYIADGSLICSQLFSSPGDVIAIFFDINGYNNGPNRAGYDLFAFKLDSKDKLIPSTGDCTISSNYSSNGYGCSKRALQEKDYFKNLPK